LSSEWNSENVMEGDSSVYTVISIGYNSSYQSSESLI